MYFRVSRYLCSIEINLSDELGFKELLTSCHNVVSLVKSKLRDYWYNIQIFTQFFLMKLLE